MNRLAVFHFHFLPLPPLSCLKLCLWLAVNAEWTFSGGLFPQVCFNSTYFVRNWTNLGPKLVAASCTVVPVFAVLKVPQDTFNCVYIYFYLLSVIYLYLRRTETETPD